MSPVQGGGAGPGLRAGVDIGATKTLTVLRDERDRVLGEAVAPTPARRGGAAILDTAAGMVLGLLTGAGAALADLAGVGVGAAGVISDDGRVTAASGSFAGWVGTEIDLELSGRLGGVPVRSENDVNAFLLAELAALGRDRPRQALAVALGTGVGGALLVDGQLLRGFGAGGGEIGHVGDFGDEPCTCGRRGHLEAYAGGWALARRYAAATGLAWTADRIASAALAGDPLAAGLFERACHCLGAAIGQACGLLGVPLAILGGGVPRSWNGRCWTRCASTSRCPVPRSRCDCPSWVTGRWPWAPPAWCRPPRYPARGAVPVVRPGRQPSSRVALGIRPSP